MLLRFNTSFKTMTRLVIGSGAFATVGYFSGTKI